MITALPTNPLHNALQQLSAPLRDGPLNGFSFSGLATYFQLPTLDLMVDVGECPVSAIGLNHVLLTHAHGDHSRCLMRHDALRRMFRIPSPAVYYVPDFLFDEAKSLMRAEAMFEGVAETDCVLPELQSVAMDEKVPLRYRPDLLIQAFPVKHSIPAAGYTVYNMKRKLLEQYANLSGNEIRDLKKTGVEVTGEVHDPYISFMGDCLGEALWEHRHVWDSPVVVCECTFIDDGEEHMARDKGHTHLYDITQLLHDLGPVINTQKIILTHFSMKYDRQHIIETVTKAVPEAFKERVEIFV